MAIKKKQRETTEAEVPLSSMIDIIFLLIIFFVVTASLDKEVQDEQVTLASSPHGKTDTKLPKTSFTINVRKSGKPNISGQEMSLAHIENALKLHSRTIGSNNFPIILRCDQNVKHGHIQKVQEAITNQTFCNVQFNAENRPEK